MPSFTVEAPADTSITSQNEILHCLRQAVSNDQGEVHAGTAQLEALEKSPGYFSVLQVSLCHNVRYDM